MAQPSSSVLRKRLEKVLINPAYVRGAGSEIGRGAYGVVVELEAYGIRCAGKRLHDVLCRADEVNEKILNDFANEILQMRKLRHPNIVQFLGIVCDDTSVTLVMEYIPTTLSQCLEKYCDPNPGIPSFIKNSILLDIAQGLLFLHCQTPAIIHRDLSSNNVLITSTWQAKICDLGVAKAIKTDIGPVPTLLGEQNTTDPRDQPMYMSLLPGTDLFMPPECRKPTQHGKVVYGRKLDCFSFGNLIIMVVLQVGWLESTLLSDVPDDETSKGRTEVERRSYHLSQMEDHPLQGLATQCLLDDPNQRPSAGDIVRTLKEVVSDDPPPFANTLDLYKAFIYTKKEESEYQKQIAALSQQNNEYQERIADLKQEHKERIAELKQEHEEKTAALQQEHEERITEYHGRTEDLIAEVEELKSKLQKQKELMEGQYFDHKGKIHGMQLTSSPNNVSCSDTKTGHKCEQTTTEMSHTGTLTVGWTSATEPIPQDTHKPSCIRPQVTPRRRGTHPIPKPRPRKQLRPLSIGNKATVTDASAIMAPVVDTLSPTGGTSGAIAPTDNPSTPVPTPRTHKPLSAALSVDSSM